MPVNSATKKQKYSWSRLPFEQLLDIKICDLGLSINDNLLTSCIEQLYRELRSKHIVFQPHFWLSDEWYCPDGVPGVAIPFFLAHKRLRQLELQQMLEVEGGDRRWCMKLLRHETGHALYNAYKLEQQRDWSKVFGNPKLRYPDTYLPKPYSKSFVINLPNWYAQSHPHEDWAETFAVWLDPRCDWRKRYKNWRAIKKLEFVDQLMGSLCAKKPLLRNKYTEYPLQKIRLTLREYYQNKRERYGVDYPEFFDIDLRKLFCNKEESITGEKASRYIRRVRTEVMTIVERWTGEYKYRINEVLKDMIKRCDELNLYVMDSDAQLLPDLSACLTMVVMSKLHGGGFHISL